MISIIIPAHNEEKVIGRTLAELLSGVRNEEFEVIVVCNGCVDKTAQVVASFGDAFKCIETSKPSKSNALNMGDAAAKYFPRVYLDADIILSSDAVKHLCNILRSGNYLAASPKMKVAYEHSSYMVRRYYDVWQQLPYVQRGMIGTGVYALSEEGRRRFGLFPDIIADDRFVRALFKEHERTIAYNCNSIVHAPKNLSGLIKIKTRSRLGGYEFERNFPDLIGNETKNYSSAIVHSLKRFKLNPGLAIYLFVNILCRFKAKVLLQKNQISNWHRDDSSRSV